MPEFPRASNTSQLPKGNGKSGVGSAVTDRLERVENILLTIQQTLDVQFKRIAAIQAELDHLRARSQT